MIAVSAPRNHGKTESTQMLVDLLYLELVTCRNGWTAEIFNRKSKSFSPYSLTMPRYADYLVVFSYNGERKIAVITAGDVMVDWLTESYQKLIEPNDISDSASHKILQASYEVVVGCCHPNNNVKDTIVTIAKDSGYDLMETNPYYQLGVTVVPPSIPVYVWNYLFAKDLKKLVLAKIGNLGEKMSSSDKADSFAAQFTLLVFAMMKDFRKSQDGFGFDIRKTNKNGRKEQGLIFYGNDDYVRVALSSEKSVNMQASTLGLVFRRKGETAHIECYLEVVCDNDSKNLGRYQNLVASIEPIQKWEQMNCKDRYLIKFHICEATDWLEAVVEARIFMEEHAKDFKDNVREVLFRQKRR